MISCHMNLSEEQRATLRRKAKERYDGPSGERQRALQYLKCLNCSLIKNCRPSTLERHNIEFMDGMYRFKEPVS